MKNITKVHLSLNYVNRFPLNILDEIKVKMDKVFVTI